jgi:hypothetical protein
VRARKRARDWRGAVWLLSTRGAQACTTSVDCEDLAAGLRHCPQLEHLVLHNLYLNCEKNANALAAVSRLHMLWHIDLRGTCAGEVTAAQLLCALPQLPRLRKLLLGINSLYGPANQARAQHMPLRPLARLLCSEMRVHSARAGAHRCCHSRSCRALSWRKST